MAFDGITIRAVVTELQKDLTGSRIAKIAQPEADELLLTFKCDGGVTRRLVVSANASLPLLYFTEENKQSPATAPAFCMLLRKHLQNGRVLSVIQPGLERIVRFRIEHLDEMGDLKTKYLIAEFMGKHSNIIFTDENDVIIDAIKRIPSSVSSVRQVLPGRDYMIPEGNRKKNPLEETREGFLTTITQKPGSAGGAITSSYEGISPFSSSMICGAAMIDPDSSVASFSDTPDGKRNLEALFSSFRDTGERIREGKFTFAIVYENGVPFEYSVLPLTGFSEENIRRHTDISSLLIAYYGEKETVSRIRQRSADLRKIVQTHLERDIRKYDLQLKQLKDTEKMDRYRLYGELLNTYGYDVPGGAKETEVLNYYTNEKIRIPLDPDLSAIENAKRFFERYQKLKRTKEALTSLTEEVKQEIDHLLSVQNSLSIARSIEDLNEIREELILGGYIRKKASEKKKKTLSKPLHYRTEDGYDIYVGKNNLQNEYITFELADGGDWWFHAKKIPGSHVIVKSKGEELPDAVFEAAASLAARYSKAEGAEKVEVDYVKRKEVKHPKGSKPGFVVYYTNYSMLIGTDISGLKLLDD
ncbi:MAG: NFACT family protein [Lachnospiraceae bacterium]|nr:NFACT family protein [Lachnospiraceae bacterium]